MAQFCRHCGAALGVGAGFCGQCGNGQGAAVVHPAAARRRARPMWAWIAVAALIPMAAAGLAVQQGWIEVPGYGRTSDTNGDGVISAAEAWQEMLAMPQFKPGRWVLRAAQGEGETRDSGRYDKPEENFGVTVGDNRQALEELFDPVFNASLIVPEWNKFINREGCVVSEFDTSHGKIVFRAICGSNRSQISMGGTYNANSWEVRTQLEYLADNYREKKFHWVETRANWVSD